LAGLIHLHFTRVPFVVSRVVQVRLDRCKYSEFFRVDIFLNLPKCSYLSGIAAKN
jgi:hypothetical protein